MPERLFIARSFLVAGGFLALVGVLLWFTLPIPSMFPPYLVTAALALGYGVACLWQGRVSVAAKS